MSLLAWLAVGLAAGLTATLATRDGPGLAADLALGLVGAFLGGWVALTLAPNQGTGILLAAVVGATLLLFSVHGPRRTGGVYSPETSGTNRN
ncbi:MAG TPA: GlsB/YeaQ/YmgE family stress response membrane protein [Rubricoccaceae bacterium]|nr:GlsB/YeaQ/YmgE family stress response membrane protein [Rubricoccaceae bacterium]